MSSSPIPAPPRQKPASVPAPVRRNRTRLAALLAAVSALCALAFPFAPVEQPVVSYHLGAPGALPLMPYQPVELTASWSCTAVRQSADAVLSTSSSLPGLRVDRAGDSVRISSYGTVIGEVPMPPGECHWLVRSDPERTEVRLDGTAVAAFDGDVRPAVSGLFTSVAGISVDLVADTRFQTSPSALKTGLGLLSALALAGALVAVGGGRRVRWRWRPHLTDAVVTAALGAWTLIGPITVDDGYIAGIVRGRGENGFVGNAYRWLNAPEAPFGWFYELYHLWAQVSVAPVWLRLPSTLLGLVCWILLSRLVIPRLGGRSRWTAALAFLAWWLPFNLGLRPEPWVAVGSLAVFCLVERAIAVRAVRPLALALVVAGLTAAVTPSGLMAFAPVLAALRPVLRLVRANPVLPAAAVGCALLPMFADQSFAAVVEAIRVRKLIGGDLPWFQEFDRYARLLEPSGFEGSLARRAPVLLTLLGLVGWVRGGRGAADRIAVAALLSLAVLVFSPTKWTHHFGDLAGVGAAVLVLCLHSWSIGRDIRRWLAGIAAVAVTGGLVLAGSNRWPWISEYDLTWNTMAPALLGVRLSDLVLVVGLLTAGVLAVRAAWRANATGTWPDWPRRAPSPALAATALLTAIVVFTVGTMARADRGYPRAACGLADSLQVETDPAEGVLPAVDGWFVLDRAQRDRTLPVVTDSSTEVEMVFARQDRSVVATRRGAGEVRVLAPEGAELVRVVGPRPPRAPRLTAMTEVVRPGTPAVVDWPVALLFPCVRPAALRDGTAEVPAWRIGPPSTDDSAHITYDADKGGPFATARELVREHQLPVYLRDDPTRDVARLFRWTPVTPVPPAVGTRSASGWQQDGRLAVPGL